jgi:GNAT superfamily N-acetyltransferase
VQARVRESRAEAITFLQNRGFVVAQRLPGLRLPLESRETPAHSDVLPDGITLTTLAQEQATNPDWLRRFYELRAAVWPDMPEATPGEYRPDTAQAPLPFLSLEQFAGMVERTIDLPDACFLARQGEEYIGWSSLAYNRTEPDCLSVGETGVRREWRRQGIARALKARTIAYARQHGYTAIITKTANSAMLALNMALGFQREEGEVRLLRTL